jgi:hypothetical protein
VKHQKALNSFYRINAHSFAVFPELLIGDNPINQGKKGIITTQAHIGAGMNSGAELTYQNIAGPDNLAAESLYATPLGITVSAVL